MILTFAKWETASGRFGGSATEGALLNRVRACTSSTGSFSGLAFQSDAEVSDTPPRPVSFSLDARLLAEVMRRIDEVLDEPRGLPNGKGKKRIKLTPDQTRILKQALIEAVEHAHVWAASRPLPNRVRGRGRPPDNAFFLFIDDVALALEGVGLKASLRYVGGSESLLVRLFIELSPTMGTGKGPAPALRAMAAPALNSYSCIVQPHRSSAAYGLPSVCHLDSYRQR
jgi:hypothetical protein